MTTKKIAKLEETLKELWNNDDNVPTPYSTRCSELDWFSNGIKDNIIAHIAIKVFGLDEAKELLDFQGLFEE